MQNTKGLQKKFTYLDYLQLDDNRRYELLGGKLMMVSSPDTKHQLISFTLGRLIGNYVVENNLGIVLSAPIDVYLDEYNLVQPDILFIACNIVKLPYFTW